MQRLKKRSLPNEVGAFVPLSTSIDASVNVRQQMLMHLHGYPVPTYILARAFSLIDMRSVSTLKMGVKVLRDCMRYAAEILSQFNVLQTDRLQLNPRDLLDIIQKNKNEYGYEALTDADLDLVVKLIISSEMTDSAWTLDLETDDNNLYLRILNLYNQVRVSASSLTSSAVEGSPDLSDDNLIMYDALSDALIPFKDLPAFKFLQQKAKTATKKIKGASTPELDLIVDRMRNEATFAFLADIRFIDHVLMLLIDMNIWNEFISPRAKASPDTNKRRVETLRKGAAYLHSMLTYYPQFRIACFHLSYSQLEKWLGSFPAISPELLENYKKYVTHYDVLGAQRDAQLLYSSYDSSLADGSGTKVSVHFTEFMDVYEIGEVIAEAAASTVYPRITFSDLTILNGNDYDTLLLSQPVGKFNLAGSVMAKVIGRAVFANALERAMESLIPAYNRFYNELLLEELKAMKVEVPFGWHSIIPLSPSIDRGTDLTIEGDNFIYPVGHIASTVDNERDLRLKELFSIQTSSSYLEKFAPILMWDAAIAAQLRSNLGLHWDTYYPSNLMNGSSFMTPGQVTSSIFSIRAFFERVSGGSFSYIEKALMSPYYREHWATILSSCGLFFVLDKNGLAADKTQAIKQALANLSEVTIVQGLGSPYGMDYHGLASIQEWTERSLFQVTNNVYFAFLTHVPLPQENTMQVGSFHLGTPYYYSPANGRKIAITEFVLNQSCLQFACRPVPKKMALTPVLFDKMYAYVNDTLVIQTDPQAVLPNNGSAPFSVSLTEQEWKGDKIALHVRNVRLKPYSTAAEVMTQGLPSDRAESEVTKMINSMETELKKTVAATPVTQEAQKPTMSAILDESSLDKPLASGKERSNGDISKKKKIVKKKGTGAQADVDSDAKAADAKNVETFDKDSTGTTV